MDSNSQIVFEYFISFQFYKMLQQHIQAKHTLEKPFKCDQCEYAHATKSGLKQHVVNSHPKDEVMLHF